MSPSLDVLSIDFVIKLVKGAKILDKKSIIKAVLEANQDINMSSKYAREYLAEEIEKEVHETMNKMFMEEYELIMNPPTEPF